MTTRLVRTICILLIVLHLGALTIVLWPFGRPAQVGWTGGVFATAVMVISFVFVVGLGVSMLLGRQRENVPWLLALLFFNVLPAVAIFVTGELLGLP
jgi:hypothetical protein